MQRFKIKQLQPVTSSCNSAKFTNIIIMYTASLCNIVADYIVCIDAKLAMF